MIGGNLLAHGWGLAFVTVFVGGFLTSLTPCVYPLIPITVSLFGGRGAKVGRGRALSLSAAYVVGIGVMYAALGVLSALLGRAFGTFLANAWVVVPLALLFAAMAASMFGAFELALPLSWQARLTKVGGAGFGGAFAMGLVGGLIAAPCTGPVLASVLAYVALTRSVVLGSSLLFTYALGMGVIFFLIAAFALSLPKSGRWMEAIKGLFGIVLVVAALYFLRAVVPPLARWGRPTTAFLLLQLGLLALGLLLGGVHRSFGDGAWRKALGVALVVAGLFGSLSWTMSSRPLAFSADERAAVAAARAAHRPVLIDFYADWCIPCHELDVKTFGQPEVRRELERFTLVKVNLSTDEDPAAQRARARYQAATLPTVVLLDSDGQVAQKLEHFVPAQALLPLLRQLR